MILISYTSQEYYLNLEDMLHECCEKFDVPHRRYSQDWFRSTDYYRQHRDVADCRRMAGFCIWKPYIILDALKDNDLVCYVDASVVFDQDPKPFIESTENIVTGDCDSSFINTTWIKRDTFYYMGCDEPKYWYGFQVWAGLIIVRKCAESYIEEMLKWCEDRRIISDDPNVCGLPNFPDFHENRSEQAILTLMHIKYPDIIKLKIGPPHDYDGNYSEWRSWKEKGRRR